MWLYLILEEPSTSRAAMVFAVVNALMILLQVLTIMMESGSFGVLASMCEDGANCTTEDFWAFTVADICLSVLFTIELALRSICAKSVRELRTSVFWWIDLLGVAPFYLQLILDAVLQESPEGLAARLEYQVEDPHEEAPNPQGLAESPEHRAEDQRCDTT